MRSVILTLLAAASSSAASLARAIPAAIPAVIPAAIPAAIAAALVSAYPRPGLSGESLFAPEGCEFGLHIAADTRPETGVWGGRRTVTVATETATYAMRAACTTGYSAEALAAVDREARLAFVIRLAEAMGLGVERIDASDDGGWIDVGGVLPSAEAVHLRARFLYGRSSRLMIEVTARDAAEAERRFGAALASVHRK